MITSTGPVFIAILSGLLLKEGFPARLLAGIAVSFGGAVVVGISTSSAGRASLLGVLLCLVAAVSYAASAVSQKSALRHASPLQVTTFGCAIGALACLPFIGPARVPARRSALDGQSQRAVPGRLPDRSSVHDLGLCAGPNSGREALGATIYAVPALTVLMSWGILGEVPRGPPWPGARCA